MLLIKFPSRSRPSKFFACIENIQSMIGIENYQIAATLDLDDLTMNNAEVKERLKKYDNLIVYWGISGSKIKAINRSVPMNIEWEYMVVTSDDFWFTLENFGRRILYDFQELCPDGDSILHYPDGYQNKKLLTLPIMGRKYYQRIGQIYHPDFLSVYADRFQMDVAKKTNRYFFIDVKIAEHRHPRFNGFEKDDLYLKNEHPSMYRKDMFTYVKLKREFESKNTL